jgi:hypothetical protein
VGEGRLDLDEPITEIVDLAGTTISPKVTVRHLLTHTSGIAEDADGEAGESYEALWVDKSAYSVMRTWDLLPQFADKPPNFAPGDGVGTATPGTSSSAWRSRRSREPLITQWSGTRGNGHVPAERTRVLRHLYIVGEPMRRVPSAR